LTATIISGGKSAGPPAPWHFLETGQTLVKETLSPFGDNLPGDIELLADLLVRHPLSGQEDDLGADDITIW